MLDLLDRLEAGIVSLRERNQEVETALRQLQSQNGFTTSKPGAREKAKSNASRASKKRAKKKAVKNTPKQPIQMPLTPAEGEEKRTAGKRLALGRSIAQLRRSGSPSGL